MKIMTRDLKVKKTLLQKIWEKYFPKYFRSAVKNLRILEKEYGHWRSAKAGMSVNQAGEPIPWFSYPATEYLNQLDLSDKNIFEYGSGNSSLYLARAAKKVISVENNEHWYRIMSQKKPDNLDLKFIADSGQFVAEIRNHGKFDVIIIDSDPIATRFSAAALAPDYLNEGGFIILDNSSWFHGAAKILRGAGLIQVDFTGFAPIIGYTTTTSFFLRRDFNFRPKYSEQPIRGIGSLAHDLKS